MSDTTPAAAAKADTAGAEASAAIEQPTEIDTHVANAKQAVREALAKQPFRASPSWQDLHTALEAVVRYVFGGQPKPANDAAPPIDQHVRGFHARVEGQTRTPPDGLSADDQTAWLAGWDEAQADARSPLDPPTGPTPTADYGARSADGRFVAGDAPHENDNPNPPDPAA